MMPRHTELNQKLQTMIVGQTSDGNNVQSILFVKCLAYKDWL